MNPNLNLNPQPSPSPYPQDEELQRAGCERLLRAALDASERSVLTGLIGEVRAALPPIVINPDTHPDADPDRDADADADPDPDPTLIIILPLGPVCGT